MVSDGQEARGSEGQEKGVRGRREGVSKGQEARGQ